MDPNSPAEVIVVFFLDFLLKLMTIKVRTERIKAVAALYVHVLLFITEFPDRSYQEHNYIKELVGIKYCNIHLQHCLLWI